MKKSIVKKILAFSLSAILCLSLAACSENSESKKTNGSNVEVKLQPGVWTDKTFKNESTNIEFTIDDKAHALTPDELKQTLGMGEDIIINNEDGFSKEDFEKSDESTIYDCMITYPDKSNVIVQYTKLNKTSELLSAKSFLKSSVNSLEELETMKYTLKQYGEATIAGDEYTTAEMSLEYQGVIQNQMYYCKKESGYIITFIFTTPEDGSPYEDQFMNSINHIKKSL